MGNSLLQKPLNWVRGGVIAHLALTLVYNVYRASMMGYRINPVVFPLMLAAQSLFLLYLFVGYPKNPRHPLLLAAMIAQGAQGLFAFYNSRALLMYLKIITPHMVSGGIGWFINGFYYCVMALVAPLMVVAAVVHIVNYAKRFRYCHLSLVAVIACGALEFMNYAIDIWLAGVYVYNIVSTVLTIIYYAAMALFWWRVAVPRTAAANANPRLYALWQQLDRGQISAEEYDRRRAELMNQ